MSNTDSECCNLANRDIFKNLKRRYKLKPQCDQPEGRMTKIKNQEKAVVGKDVGQLELSCISGTSKNCKHFEELYYSFLKSQT